MSNHGHNHDFNISFCLLSSFPLSHPLFHANHLKLFPAAEEVFRPELLKVLYFHTNESEMREHKVLI